jgi:hypothetical protein
MVQNQYVSNMRDFFYVIIYFNQKNFFFFLRLVDLWMRYGYILIGVIIGIVALTIFHYFARKSNNKVTLIIYL